MSSMRKLWSNPLPRPVSSTKPDGTAIHFVATCRIDTPVEVEYYRHGGILHKVLRDLVKG